MQIDFHHGVTYICARLAGFSANDAQIVAHSAQYVDDATAEGEIWFDNGMIYPRTASAHKMLDYRNMRDLANHRVWLPFHFLPGNNGDPAPTQPPVYRSAEEFIVRCICRPNSPPARDLMRAVIERQDRPYALHRLGVAAHVFTDTWAHQGFVGYQHQINLASNIEAENDSHHKKNFYEKSTGFFGMGWEQLKSIFVGAALPLGHGTVLSYPDRPYLRWSYTDGLGQPVRRDNPKEFLEAARETYQHFRRYRDWPEAGSKVFQREYPLPQAFDRIGVGLREIRDEDETVRHRKWLDRIGDGMFGFRDRVAYIEKGQGSWKQKALSTDEDIIDNRNAPLPYPASFLDSDWKLFHDALQAHRFFVLHELLPRYGLLSG